MLKDQKNLEKQYKIQRMLAESDFVNVREPNRGEDHYSYIKILINL